MLYAYVQRRRSFTSQCRPGLTHEYFRAQTAYYFTAVILNLFASTYHLEIFLYITYHKVYQKKF